MTEWYCASCGVGIESGAHLYVGDGGALLHDEADGTASCGPVLLKARPEARRAFVVEIDAILSELLVLCDVTTEAGAAHEARLSALRRYVLNKFGNQVALQEPDFGLLTRRLIQRVVAEWPHYASNALNDDIEAQLREAWTPRHAD